MKATTAITLVLAAAAAGAQTTLIDNARVHTLKDGEVIENGDVLVRDGRIEQVGTDIDAPGDARVIDAGGLPLTPGLFAGITGIGLERISLEQPTVDNAVSLSAESQALNATMRPEFDVTRAFNPLADTIAITRVEGFTHTLLGAGTPQAGGSILAGRGAVVRLDGDFADRSGDARTVFINLGADASQLSGQSRAAQFMLLEQAMAELDRQQAEPPLLTPLGRQALQELLASGHWVFQVDRAADIVETLAFAEAHGIRPIIEGGAEAWRVAGRLADANAAVLLDPLVNLPYDFDHLGARLDNAAKLDAAGVTIAFSQRGRSAHNARKVRQLAGNAVANGLPYDTALAALTRTPARLFGLDDTGSIAPGQRADLVLWSGDPLEVTTWAKRVWIGGEAMPMRSRQSELLLRYLPEDVELPRQYLDTH